MLSQQVRDHLEKYWKLSIRFYKEGDYALAAFFAITLIEEIGKVAILAKKTLGGKFDKKAFYKHEEKYSYAVAFTLLINSRVTRITVNSKNALLNGSRKENYSTYVIMLYILKRQNQVHMYQLSP